MKRTLKLVLVNIAIALLVIVAFEQILRAFDFPDEASFRPAHRPNVSRVLKTIEFEYDFVTNDLGLRYPAIEPEKPEQQIRILLLGDSFTEGVGVQAHETFAYGLQNYYASATGRSIRFINGGLGGKGPIDFWRLFRDVGLSLQPDGLLICLYANDLMDTGEHVSREDLYSHQIHRQGAQKLLHSVFPRVYMLLSEAGRILSREWRQSKGFVATISDMARDHGVDEETIQQWHNRLSTELVEASERKEFNRALLSIGLLNPDYWVEALEITTPSAERKYRAMVFILDEMVRLARSNGTLVGLVFVPAPLQYDLSRHQDWNPWIVGGAFVKERWAHEDSEVQRRLSVWAENHSVPFLDLTPFLREGISDGRELNYRLDGHWTPEGHRVAEEAISGWLERGNVFPTLFDSRSPP